MFEPVILTWAMALTGRCLNFLLGQKNKDPVVKEATTRRKP
jgi:hypothetical protein